jgi:RNA recognition motif
MTFKLPSPAVYFGSLLVTLPFAGLVYWVLQSQQLAASGLVTLGAGLLIGHLIAACSQPSAGTKSAATPAAQVSASSSDEDICLYVGNLAYRAQQNEVQALFEQFGRVNSVRIMTDRATRRPRGYAFVEMEANAAREALSQLDNTDFCERNLRVSEAKQRRAEQR